MLSLYEKIKAFPGEVSKLEPGTELHDSVLYDIVGIAIVMVDHADKATALFMDRRIPGSALSDKEYFKIPAIWVSASDEI